MNIRVLQTGSTLVSSAVPDRSMNQEAFNMDKKQKRVFLSAVVGAVTGAVVYAHKSREKEAAASGDGQTVMITGAPSGIGKEFARGSV